MSPESSKTSIADKASRSSSSPGSGHPPSRDSDDENTPLLRPSRKRPTLIERLRKSRLWDLICCVGCWTAPDLEDDACSVFTDHPSPSLPPSPGLSSADQVVYRESQPTSPLNPPTAGPNQTSDVPPGPADPASHTEDGRSSYGPDLYAPRTRLFVGNSAIQADWPPAEGWSGVESADSATVKAQLISSGLEVRIAAPFIPEIRKQYNTLDWIEISASVEASPYRLFEPQSLEASRTPSSTFSGFSIKKAYLFTSVSAA